jgi:hypothetical protein
LRGGLFGRRVFAATADKSIYTAEMHVYKVSGRFSFSPDLAMYPFDRQTLSVVIEPKDPSDPFLIQPLSAMAEGP